MQCQHFFNVEKKRSKTGKFFCRLFVKVLKNVRILQRFFEVESASKLPAWVNRTHLINTTLESSWPVFSTGFLLNIILVFKYLIEISIKIFFKLYPCLVLISARCMDFKSFAYISFQIYVSILSPIEKSLKSCFVKRGLKSR